MLVSARLLIIVFVYIVATVNAGSLYAWGDFLCDEECQGERYTDTYVPKAFNAGSLAGKNIQIISTGNQNSIVVDSNQKIHTWTWSGEVNNEEIPRIATSAAVAGKSFVKVSAGDLRVMALSSDGHAYLWFPSHASSIPTEIDMSGVLDGLHIIDISVGRDHNLVVANTGRVYAWGKNDVGQLGDGAATSYNLPAADSEAPVAVKTTGVLNSVFVKSVVAADKHSIALSYDGNSIFTWGSTEFGQAGIGVSGYVGEESDRYPKFENVPNKVLTPNGLTFIQIAGGKGFDLALTTNYEVYGWGANFDGTLAQADFFNIDTPHKLNIPNNLDIYRISAGATHTLLLGSAGMLHTVGRNQNGALGVDEFENSFKSNVLLDVVSSSPLTGTAIEVVSAGSHSLVLSSAPPTAGPTTNAPTTKAPTTKTPTTRPSTTSPPNNAFGNFHYVLVLTPKNPLSADAHCQTLGGRLASITGPALNTFIQSSFAGKSQEYWIGLRKVEVGYKWIDNIQPVSYTNFDTNPGTGTYTLFINNAAKGTVGKWKSQSGTVQKPFLCKIRNL